MDVQQDLYELVRAMPKIELHRHLEGSVRLETLIDIARDFGMEMPEYHPEVLRPFVQMMPDEPRTWQNFLAKFRVLRQFFLSPNVIRRITREVIEDAARDNVKYMELRFTPRALCNSMKATPEEVVRWVCETAHITAEACNIQVRLIVSMNRHESVEVGEQVTKAAISHMHMGVVGIDLAGIESDYTAYPFRHVFQMGRAAGLHVTLHAGEWQGADSVWDAISNIGAERLGHGIRSIEDGGVVNVLLDRNVTLEVCPSSNVDSGVVKNMASHQLPILVASGLLVTINTDDPLVSGISLTDELMRVLQYLPFTIDDIKQFMLNAARASFLDDSERRVLVAQFEEWLKIESN
ncbi:MAG: adenosine deaminase [Phototrophicales bacterium]|nr:adenosine deaminase [Phototrophicales bacterium]